MSKQFFSLENIMLGSMFLILIIYSGFMISCIAPADRSGSDLFSLDRNNDDNDDDDVAFADRRRGSSRDRRPCEDRDSCQDSCDYMFRNSSARSECYELNFDDVSDLEHVFDELHSSSISLRSLEDIDVDDFEEFLELDVDGWVDIIVGEEGGDHNHKPYDSMEAKSALEWIAENENVARAIESVDEHHDILYHLFLRLNRNGSGGLIAQIPKIFNSFTRDGVTSARISWCDNGLKFISSCSGKADRPLSGDLEFALSFIGAGAELKFSGDSFITYAEDEDNEAAIELAHESLVRFCEDATDDELPDEEVQQCMLASYCSIYNEEQSDNIFEDVLSDYDAEKEDCVRSVLGDINNDDLEDLFD